jgi:hypothetical protein
MKFISLLLFSFVVLSAMPAHADCPAHAAEEAEANADDGASKCPHAEKKGDCPHKRGGDDAKAECSKCAGAEGDTPCPDCKAGCEGEEGCAGCEKGCDDEGCPECAAGCDKSDSEN